MDFFANTGEGLEKLSGSERSVFNYVVKNTDRVKNMSIRELAAACHVSTTTLFRFVKKLGYEGYSEFIAALRRPEPPQPSAPEMLPILRQPGSYLNGIARSVEGITPEKQEKFDRLLDRRPTLCILADGPCRDAAAYIHRVLLGFGFDAFFPKEDYEFRAVRRRLGQASLLLVLGSGSEPAVVRRMEEIFADVTPSVISITRGEVSLIRNMSDLDFRVFAEEFTANGEDLTSVCGMIAVFESLILPRIAPGGQI